MTLLIPWISEFSWQQITLASAAFFVLELCAFFSIYHALRHVRTSQAAVGWTVGLATIPVLVLPLYWIFSRNRFYGYREAIRDVGQRHQQSVSAIRDLLLTERHTRTTDMATPLEELADALDSPITAGNRFKLLIDGEATFDSIITAIARAKKYVYVSFFIIRDDHLGDRLADVLVARAKAGVQIRVLYDEVGSLRLSHRYLHRLTEAGIEIRSFNTRQGWINRFQINFRNHRKMVIVDGQFAVVGGLNVGDEYLGEASGLQCWRDTAVATFGPIARQVQAIFAVDYYWSARHDLPEACWEKEPPTASASELFPETFPDATGGGEDSAGRGTVCMTGPADVRPRASMMFAAAAQAAQHRLWISTPYLVPDDAIMLSLHLAKARGVDVRVMIPAQADHFAVYLAGFYFEGELAEAGIPVYRYKAGFLHQKCLLVDSDLALIGSTNLDNRSLHLNFELMVAIEQREFLNAVVAMLERDFANSAISNVADAPVRWWFERLGTAVARLFSPIL